jgi:hypothetical protein
MREKLTKLVVTAAIALVGAIGISTLQFAPTYAACNTPACQVKIGTKAAGSDTETTSLGEKVKVVVNVLLFLIGAVSVIVIIIGGIRYVTSNGDASQVTGAKNTILYAVIGIIVALLAYAIVNFVVKQFS